jgi:hypothetical protein
MGGASMDPSPGVLSQRIAHRPRHEPGVRVRNVARQLVEATLKTP